MESAAATALLKHAVPLILTWYDRCARTLPWRSEPTPYRIWVSEVMLQQTRVEAALPYFMRFVAAVPDVAALDAISEPDLLRLWEGLGYYSRVRNMKKAAHQLMERYDGEIPASFEALRALPGLGDYAAGAVASIAFGLPVPAVDGNVMRVVSRLMCSEEDVSTPAAKRALTALIIDVLPGEGRVGDFNQALMELGAIICLPNGAPRCVECPLETLCEGNRHGMAHALPIRTHKKPSLVQQKTVFCFTNERNEVAFRPRPKRGILAGMWEMPNAEGHLAEEEARCCVLEWGVCPMSILRLADARHLFTHITWDLWVYRVLCCGTAPIECVWTQGRRPDGGQALPSAFGQILKREGLL